MNTASTPSRPSIPVLGIFLLFTGVVLLAILPWLSNVDLVATLQNRIGAAQGSMSAESTEWLRGINFPAVVTLAGLTLVILGGGVLLVRPRLFRNATAPSLPNGSSSVVPAPSAPRRWALPVGSCLVVLVRYFPTLQSGFFRYDDFEFVAVAHDERLWDSMWLPHGDHFLPLTRILFHVADHLFGVTAWPYNVAVLFCMCAVLVAGCLLLEELKVSRVSQAIFVCLMIGWSPWGEMMSGYYVLSTYMLIAALSIAAAWLYIRWRRIKGYPETLAFAACAGLAPLIDVSGWYVPAVCVVFMVTDFGEHRKTLSLDLWLRRRGRLLTWFVLSVCLSLGITWYNYTVLHPGVFLGMANHAPRSIGRFAADLAYLFSTGVLLSMATPFIYARLPFIILVVLATTAFVAWLAFFMAAFRSAAPSRRWTLLTILIVALGTGTMVILGRPTGDTMIVRWAAKHVCLTYVWICVLLSAGWDALWVSSEQSRRRWLTELTLVLL